MMSCLFVTLNILAAAGSVRANPKVMERSSSYPCCRPQIPFNETCETAWSVNDTVIALFEDSGKKCVYPCKKIEDGQMTLDECVAVVAQTVCSEEQVVVLDQTVNYYSQPCSGSPGNHGSVGLSLLAVAIGGFSVDQMIH